MIRVKFINRRLGATFMLVAHEGLKEASRLVIEVVGSPFYSACITMFANVRYFSRFKFFSGDWCSLVLSRVGYIMHDLSVWEALSGISGSISLVSWILVLVSCPQP